MINPDNGKEPVTMEMLFEGEISRVPDFSLKKIRSSDKWEKADDSLVVPEKLWNDNSYLYGAGDPDYLKLGRDNRTFCEIATEKTGLYRIKELDSYDGSMYRDELADIAGEGNLFSWVRFYGRIEIHGVIYGGTKTKVIITHIQKIYFRKVM